MHCLTRLPPLHLSDDAILAARADRLMFPRIIQALVGVECGIIGIMALLQFFLLPPAYLSDQSNLPLTACLVLAGLGGLMVGLVNGLYGRLGGKVTGWPWGRRSTTGSPPESA
jgi:hypothetical protein